MNIPFPAGRSPSPEFALIAACCRWPPDSDRAFAVQQAARAPIDWPRVVGIARRQRVEGLVKAGLEESRIAIPEGAKAALDIASRDIARRNLLHAAESLRLLHVFRQARIPLLFIKGVVLGQLAYGTVGLKRERDIDILIPAEAIEGASASLERSGYRRVIPAPEYSQRRYQAFLKASKETIWRHPGKDVLVELHTRLADNPMLLKGVGASSPSQDVELGGSGALPTLRDQELFAYLCVHGAAHAWSRLKWLADLRAFVARDDGEPMSRLYEEAAAVGAGRCAAQALLLSESLLGLRLDPPFGERLRRDWASLPLVRASLKMMAGKNECREIDAGVLTMGAAHFSHFLLGRGLRYKAFELRRKLFNPHHPALLALPQWLAFLSPLLIVPAWFARRVKRAWTNQA